MVESGHFSYIPRDPTSLLWCALASNQQPMLLLPLNVYFEKKLMLLLLTLNVYTIAVMKRL
jgi:hypothetical protein